MIRGTCIGLVLFALLSACGTDNPVANETRSAQSATTTTATSPASTSPAATNEDDTAGEDVVDYVAAVDELLAETGYADAILEDPDVFVATGWLLCDQLDSGLDPANILTTYVEAITWSSIDAADDDTLVLAGTLLGTAVGHLCPEHTERVEQAL